MLFSAKNWQWGLIATSLFYCSGCGGDAAQPAVEQTAVAEADASKKKTEASDSQPEQTSTSETESVETEESPQPLPEPPRLPPPENAKAMPEPNRVWVDSERGVVLVDGYVSLREGMLEMFVCPVGTKEHESVIAVYAGAQVVHAALLALGAEPGHPVRFEPEFEPPTGTEISVEVRWLDGDGQWQSISGQQWVKDVTTGKPMKEPWVFAGSGFWKDEETGKEYYLAEAGDFICVSNFSTATLDIPAESSQVNDGLLFEANTEQIPPLGTPVRVILNPKVKQWKSRATP